MSDEPVTGDDAGQGKTIDDGEPTGSIRDGVDADAAAQADAPPPAQPDAPKERTPTLYGVLVWDYEEETFNPLLADASGADGRPVLRSFEGFRKQQIVDDLTAEGVIPQSAVSDEENVEVTPWLLIVPISSAQVTRGREHIIRQRKTELE